MQRSRLPLSFSRGWSVSQARCSGFAGGSSLAARLERTWRCIGGLNSKVVSAARDAAYKARHRGPRWSSVSQQQSWSRTAWTHVSPALLHDGFLEDGLTLPAVNHLINLLLCGFVASDSHHPSLHRISEGTWPLSDWTAVACRPLYTAAAHRKPYRHAAGLQAAANVRPSDQRDCSCMGAWHVRPRSRWLACSYVVHCKDRTLPPAAACMLSRLADALLPMPVFVDSTAATQEGSLAPHVLMHLLGQAQSLTAEASPA